MKQNERHYELISCIYRIRSCHLLPFTAMIPVLVSLFAVDFVTTSACIFRPVEAPNWEGRSCLTPPPLSASLLPAPSVQVVDATHAGGHESFGTDLPLVGVVTLVDLHPALERIVDEGDHELDEVGEAVA